MHTFQDKISILTYLTIVPGALFNIFLFFIRVMLNSAPVHLLSMLKKEIKNKSNNNKITFYTFKILNAQFPKEKFS
jgi:hypothetical protein